ncbi:MAG TPA: SDR family oxidoreductase [Baekduia sp.]|uniref:SDR family NAD(P)-dependent oxidoreductase n=1 Tax=Baekduia sp. TaxID=2600305 RepID=UPI002D78776C|nr:SDR family oxidoreductase [Baekduia sp.]HET6509949.1 SDR family oxidoreductase [Baekduia sp.]
MSDSSSPPDAEAVPDYAAMGRLDGRGVLVAGAGAGIGRQTAHALAAVGARVGCVDLTPALAAGVADEVGGVALVGDIADEDDLARLLAQARAALGPITGIVDIVGGARFVDIIDSTLADWEQSQHVNLRHALLLARLGSAAMAADGGGSLVYISSYDGMSGSAHHAFYGMAKAALLSLVRSAAVEQGELGVRVNAVSPGIVWTPRMGAVIGDDYPRWAGLGPLGRTALPSDVAAAALFLISDLSAYVTGQNLLLDGGVDVVSPYPIGDLYRKANAAKGAGAS